MTRLPEKIRRTLERKVKEMMLRDDVYGLGMFGSWSRGDAEASSDVDLLVISGENLKGEHVERVVASNFFLDFDFIPGSWIKGPIPPELDQKLYESQILYDRDWSLANAKLLVTKNYSSPERVDIRTETHVVDSDIYLSRATSAFSKGDFRSARIFAVAAMENILKIPLEIALEPFSNSRFLEKLEFSIMKLGLTNLLNDYLTIAQLDQVEKDFAEEKLRLLRTIWEETGLLIKYNPKIIEKLHFKVKANLKYYFNPAFLQGMTLRTKTLIASKNPAEALRYLKSTFLQMTENYAWLRASMEKAKIDYTCLIGCLESLEKKNPRHCKNIINFLDVDHVEKKETSETIEKAKRLMLKIRGQRRLLIKKHL